MSVFLRWGIFGILGVAGLLYAYNASKRLAEAHASKAAAATSTPAPANDASAARDAATEEPAPAADEAIARRPDDTALRASAQCEAELKVAQRAIDMRQQGEPLDRLLRIPEIAWQEPLERRRRLETVATRWFNYEGDFKPAALRIAVLSDCAQSSPVPAP